MREPSKKTMVIAGAASAGLIAIGGTIAVAADGSSTPVSSASSGTAIQLDRSTTTSSTTATSTPDSAIGRAEAERIALRTVPGARLIDIEFDTAEPNDDDRSDSVDRWEVDLVRGDVVHDVDVDANSGAILKNRSEVDDDSDRRDDDGSDDRDHDRYDDHGGDRDDDDHHDDDHGGDDRGDDDDDSSGRH